MSFRRLELETTRIYYAGDFDSALRRLDAAAGDYPELGFRCKIAFLRACLLARLGTPDTALDVLEAGLDDGLWWAASMLADGDLDSCRGDRLDRITRAAQSARPAQPDCFVRDGATGGGVLLALHGGGECVAERDDPWAAAVDAGWTVHRPMSSQRRGAGLATWTDLDLAVEECRMHLARIGAIDAIGAFSLGASVALRLIAAGVHVPVLMVAPSLRPDAIDRAIDAVEGLAIDIVIGDDDPFLPYASKGADRVRAAGATVRMETLPGVAHHFPTDFDSLVGQRLERLAHSDR